VPSLSYGEVRAEEAPQSLLAPDDVFVYSRTRLGDALLVGAEPPSRGVAE
jgi:hypothetical protein